MSANYTKNGLRFDAFTSSPRGLASNAVLISGTHEAVLVDTTFLPSDAPGLIDMVRDVSTILISHAHPDHYGALSLIREAFPDVRILARQGVIDGILEWPAKLVHWQEMLGDDLALEDGLSGTADRLGTAARGSQHPVRRSADLRDGARHSLLHSWKEIGMPAELIAG